MRKTRHLGRAYIHASQAGASPFKRPPRFESGLFLCLLAFVIPSSRPGYGLPSS